jgi:hypothetical protein
MSKKVISKLIRGYELSQNFVPAPRRLELAICKTKKASPAGDYNVSQSNPDSASVANNVHGMTYGSRTRCYICSIEMPFLLRDTEKRRARSGASFVRSSYYAYCQQVWYGDGLVGITREEACYRSDTGPDSRRSRWVQCQCRILLVAHNQSWPRLSCYLKHAKFAGCSADWQSLH